MLYLYISKFDFYLFHRAKPVSGMERSGMERSGMELHCGPTEKLLPVKLEFGDVNE